MKTLFSKYLSTIIVFTFCGIFITQAQENIAPITSNPFINKREHSFSTYKTTALTLPFFEDFNQQQSIPDSNKWVERQVYINNTMAVDMISYGVATFDAISQYGKPYDTVNPFTIRNADSLTSKQIDLGSKLPSDSVYLSFFYQAAGIGFAPEKQDSLMLFFKSKLSSTWIKVWSISDTSLHPFKQILIPIKDTLFLHSGFQFRFINKASIGVNDDTWNLDYIKIDEGRNIFDTLINDVAYTTSPSSLLNDYTSMPYRQYIANPSLERSLKLKSDIKNNFLSNLIIPNLGYEATLKSKGIYLGNDAETNHNVNALNTSNISLNSYSVTPTVGYYDKVIFENKFHLESPTSDKNKSNDTIIGQQIFDNYLSYDDGSAEMSYYLNLFPTLPGKIAIEHHLNQADTLRGMAIYFGRQVPLASYKYFSIVVYKSITYGSSTKDEIIYEIENLQPSYKDTINHFWIYKFDKPIPIPTGTFYIGTTQPALSGSDSLYIGLDRNRTTGNHAYYNVLNVWSPSLISGALMMRPILGKEIIGSKVQSISNKPSNFSVWPNPTTNELFFKRLNPTENIHYTVKSLLGMNIIEGNLQSSEQSINVSSLTSGQYFLELSTQEIIYPPIKFIKL